MRVLAGILTVLSVVSCGKNDILPKLGNDLYENLNPTTWNEDAEYFVDKELKPFITKFEKEYNVRVDFSVSFGKLENGVAGVCKKYSDGQKIVKISSKHWDGYNDEQKEQLVYHELGHCELNLGHNSKGTNTVSKHYQCPNSIMYPSVFSEFITAQCYTGNEVTYYEELKTK